MPVSRYCWSNKGQYLLFPNQLFKFITMDNDAHWIMSTNLEGTVAVYDSLYSGELSRSLQIQLTQFYKFHFEDSDDLTVLSITIPPVQQQPGKIECGVFALAFVQYQAYNHYLQNHYLQNIYIYIYIYIYIIIYSMMVTSSL